MQGQVGLRRKRGPGPRAGGQARVLRRGTRLKAKPSAWRTRVLCLFPGGTGVGSHQSVATGSKLWFGVPCFGVPRNENVSLQTEVLPRRSHRLRRAGEIAHGRPAGHIPHAVHAPAAGVPGEARAAVPRLTLPRGDGPHGLRALGGPTARPPRPRPLTEAPPGPANLGSLRRLPRLLGGVRKERLAAHAHPQQRDARVQSPGPVLPHHLHHRRDRRHRGRRRPGHLVHHLVRSAARSVGGTPGALLAPRGGSGARGAGVSAQMPPGPLKGGVSASCRDAWG